MFSTIKNWFDRKKEERDIPQDKPCKYKKRSGLEKVSTLLTIFITLFVIYKLNILTLIKDSVINQDHLAVVNISGMIASNTDANGANLSKAIQKAFENPSSKAVVLTINSGGGSPYQAEMVWNEIQHLKSKHKDKKVYAVVEDIGASAAYQIASASDEIIVGKSSLIGSIGVIMSNYDLTDLMKKAGVDDRTMTAGSNKAAFSYTRPVTDEQMAHYQGMLDNVHSHFIKYVRDGRSGKLKETPDMFSGLVWTGDQAVKVGIADKVGDMNMLKREMKLDVVKDYTVRSTGLEGILGATAQNIGASLGQGISEGVSNSTQVELR